MERKLVSLMAQATFTEQAHDVVLVGGPGTSKMHLAAAIGFCARHLQHHPRARA